MLFRLFRAFICSPNGLEDRLEHRLVDESSISPVNDQSLSLAERRSDLARDRHDHDVPSAHIVAGE